MSFKYYDAEFLFKMEDKSSGDVSLDEVEQQQQPSTPSKVVVDDHHHLSPIKSKEFLKPRSPLGFLKSRLGNKKRRESGGQSEASRIKTISTQF